MKAMTKGKGISIQPVLQLARPYCTYGDNLYCASYKRYDNKCAQVYANR